MNPTSADDLPRVEAEAPAPLLAQLGQLRVGGGAVDLGLAAAEPAQVGSVEDVDVHAATSP